MVNKSEHIAIIPARGGSKRIPNKNIIPIAGKPMIAWTIEAAINSNIFERIIVSTDSESIAKIALEYGAEVPFLRKEKADDFSSISEATIHTLLQLSNLKKYKYITQLMAVCPVRDDNDIINAHQHFELNKNKLQLSCFKFGFMNPWWAFELDSSGTPKKIFTDNLIRSQDLPELFCPTGAIWIGEIEELIREGSFYGKNHKFWEINWKRAIDIDNYEDFELAEIILKSKLNVK
jgi:CMP-N-acetylneuraminic acid synthetase